MSIDGNTYSEYFMHFGNPMFIPEPHYSTPKETLKIELYKCPSCEEVTITASGYGSRVKDIFVPIFPISLAKQFPDYIPDGIRKDYEEACAIVNLSPKASATLSRRCLQGMIRDYWGITDSSLYKEIDGLKSKIDPSLWKVIDSLRQLGNIGAHMEKDINTIVDIDSGEAQQLINLIEMLIKEWYINRYEREQLFSSILDTNSDKQAQRKEENV
jgi:hypothetical protein